MNFAKYRVQLSTEKSTRVSMSMSTQSLMECRTFRPPTFRLRTFRPRHFGHGHFGHGKCQRWTFRPNPLIVGWGVYMHKCVMHFLGNNCLNNHKHVYYICLNFFISYYRVPTGQGKVREICFFFQVREKSGNSVK